MTAIYLLNILVAMLLMFWPVWFARTQIRLPWVNPFSIVLIVTLPIELMRLFVGPLFLIDDGLFDTGYQYALLMTSMLALMQLMGAVFFFRFSRSVCVHRYLPFQRVTIGRPGLRRGARFFLFVYVIALLALANAEYGIWNWLLNPRLGYQLFRTGQGHWFALATSALSVSFVLAFLAHPTPGRLLLNLVIYIAFGYFLGYKAVLLSIFTATLVFLWFLRWRHLGKLVFVGVPILFGLLAFNLYLALGNIFELGHLITYFDHFKNAADYYRGYLNSEVDLFYGEVAVSSLWSYVPRIIWPDKPMVYGILHVNEIFYPNLASMSHTPAFGGAVDQHADFGPLGVIIFGFFGLKSISTGLLSYLIFRRPGLRFDYVTLATVLLVIVQYAPSFGSFLPGGLYFLALVAILSLLRVMRGPRRSAARDKQNPSGGLTASDNAQ